MCRGKMENSPYNLRYFLFKKSGRAKLQIIYLKQVKLQGVSKNGLSPNFLCMKSLNFPPNTQVDPTRPVNPRVIELGWANIFFHQVRLNMAHIL